MSKTYRAKDDGLVHTLSHAGSPSAYSDTKLYAWCGRSFKVVLAAYVENVREPPGDTVTCVRCLNNAFRRTLPPGVLKEIITDNSVKDLQTVTDEAFTKEVDGAIAALRRQYDKRRFR